MSAVLDTHAVVWYLQDSKQLSPLARRTIEDEIRSAHDIYLSAISLIELTYLVERGRLPAAALRQLQDALEDETSGLLVASVDAAVANAIPGIPRDVVPDMPDRIIAATALYLSVPLITRDRRIQSAGIRTIW
jgi:PIN domain nuclease of toxin-antitoxin system